MEKTKTTVRIAGKDYTIAGYDGADWVRRVAALVDRRMAELAQTTGLPPAQLAVLTAVNLADEMLRSKDSERALRDELDRTRRELEALLREADR